MTDSLIPVTPNTAIMRQKLFYLTEPVILSPKKYTLSLAPFLYSLRLILTAITDTQPSGLISIIYMFKQVSVKIKINMYGGIC